MFINVVQQRDSDQVYILHGPTCGAMRSRTSSREPGHGLRETRGGGPERGWSLSFAGCGFRSVYYIGALSCLLQQVPELVHGAARYSGASSGCLVAAALAVGLPLTDLCGDLLTVAAEARGHSLSVFHPSFSLLSCARRSLMDRLPVDAHVRASGRLCVSLTRVHDGKNLLVSDFSSRDELIQVLMCSCFFPVYCGFIPPSFRGVRYMDGALSNNQPLSEFRNTLTIAPFSGESDICPTEGTFNFLEVHYGNVSIQVNTGNVHRVWTSFMPTPPQMLSEICVNGYRDTLRFLSQSGLVQTQSESVEKSKNNKNGLNVLQENKTETGSLPAEIGKVLAAACSDSETKSVLWTWFSEVSLRLGLVLDLVLGLIHLMFLPFGLILNLVVSFLSSRSCSLSCDVRKQDSNLDQKRTVVLLDDRDLTKPTARL